MLPAHHDSPLQTLRSLPVLLETALIAQSPTRFCLCCISCCCCCCCCDSASCQDQNEPHACCCKCDKQAPRDTLCRPGNTDSQALGTSQPGPSQESAAGPSSQPEPGTMFSSQVAANVDSPTPNLDSPPPPRVHNPARPAKRQWPPKKLSKGPPFLCSAPASRCVASGGDVITACCKSIASMLAVMFVGLAMAIMDGPLPAGFNCSMCRMHPALKQLITAMTCHAFIEMCWILKKLDKLEPIRRSPACCKSFRKQAVVSSYVLRLYAGTGSNKPLLLWYPVFSVYGVTKLTHDRASC